LRFVKVIAASPEFNLALFAMLVNLPWELWQIPFFRGMGERPHADGVRACTEAAAGDALITLLSFWVVAAVARSRNWVPYPSSKRTFLFVACGIVATAGIELAALRVGRWTYDARMPILPLMGIGLVPLAQWLVLPPVVLWLVRRHLV